MTTSIAADEVSIERLTATVAELASDRYAGRRVGTAAGRAVGAWLADQLRELGAAVSRDSFPVQVRDLYATPVLRWNGESLQHRRDFVEHLASAELAEVRRGEAVSAAVADWSGRWIVAPEPSASAVERARSDCAIGLLIPRGVDDGGWMPKMIAGPSRHALPVVAVRTDLHQRLAAEGGTVDASMPLRDEDVNGSNVHGTFTTAPAGRPSILLTAHYDGVGDDPEIQLPAAGDNASGVAAVLEATRILTAQNLDLGLAVTFHDAEEAGARGSAHHASRVAPGTFVINLDGAAQLGDAAAVEAGGPAHPLLAALDTAGREVGVPLRAGPMPSDNRRYADIGLPAVGIGMGIPGYQTPAETPERVDPVTLELAARLLIATVRNLVS